MEVAQSRPGRHVLIGVGNRDRGDDAVGPIVCDLVGEDPPPDLTIAVLEGSVIDLPTWWEPDDHVTIVDATEPTGTPGRITTVDVVRDRVRSPATISTHSIDVGAAIELARALDHMPVELQVVGIEAASFEFDAPLSIDVQRAAASVATGFSRHARRSAAGS